MIVELCKQETLAPKIDFLDISSSSRITAVIRGKI